MAVGGRRLRLVSLLAAITISGWSIFGWTGFGSDLTTSASSAGTVSVIESTHRVEFPHRFVLTLEARAPSNIESTRVHYTIGDAPVSVYAYPTRLSHRGNLSAEFEIQTGSSGFIPQGVDVEYYYAFTDTSGRTTLSERFSFEYLDPRYRWAAYWDGRLHSHLARHARFLGQAGRRRCLLPSVQGKEAVWRR